MTGSSSAFTRMFESVYRFVFVRKFMYPLNKKLYKLALRGIGVMNYETPRISGEAAFMKKIFARTGDKPTVVDVGANVGDYAAAVKEHYPQARLYAFEPHPLTFQKLASRAAQYGFVAVQQACSEENGTTKFYDYARNTGSQHASLYKDIFEQIYQDSVVEYDVSITSLDHFRAATPALDRINLLKIDTEGNEMRVLQGAEKTIRAGGIDVIYFEFNQMNVISRTFFKDIYNLLKEYEFYRLFPDSLIPMGSYDPVFFEIFVLQNVVAIRKEVRQQYVY